jgi:hypothetical protein
MGYFLNYPVIQKMENWKNENLTENLKWYLAHDSKISDIKNNSAHYRNGPNTMKIVWLT